MTGVDERLANVEAQLEQLKPSLSARITALEEASTARVVEPRSAGARFLAWMGSEAPKLVAAAVMLFLTWGIKDSVDQAVSRQQLQLSFTKEMQAQLEKMADPNASKTDIERAALLMAAYGEPAVLPLLDELRYGDLRANGAEAGLRYLALVDPQGLCRVLPRVLTNRTRQFGWNTHLRVIRLIGESGCKDAGADLRRYRDALQGARDEAASAAFFERVADSPKADQVEQLDQALRRSLRLVDQR